jgi:hypothetical protein
MMIEKESYIMNEYSTFNAGVVDAVSDVSLGLVFDESHLKIDWLTNEFRVRLNCSDSYLAGYFSVVFAE